MKPHSEFVSQNKKNKKKRRPAPVIKFILIFIFISFFGIFILYPIDNPLFLESIKDKFSFFHTSLSPTSTEEGSKNYETRKSSQVSGDLSLKVESYNLEGNSGPVGGSPQEGSSSNESLNKIEGEVTEGKTIENKDSQETNVENITEDIGENTSISSYISMEDDTKDTEYTKGTKDLKDMKDTKGIGGDTGESKNSLWHSIKINIREFLEKIKGRGSQDKAFPDKLTINFYFCSLGEDSKLVGEKRTILAGDVITAVSNAMNELLKGPTRSYHFPVIPAGTKILGVEVYENVAKIDLSQEFLENSLDTRILDEYIIYSIVNTLTEIPEIDGVIFYIDGKRINVYGNIDLSIPIIRNEGFIAK